MKHLKKLASVLLALVMAAALMTPALAYTASGTSKIEVKDHDFYAFQLFKGEPVNDGADGSEPSKYFKTGTITWGDDLNTAALRGEFVRALIGVCGNNAALATAKAELEALKGDNDTDEIYYTKAGEVAAALAKMYDEYDSERSRAISDAIWEVFVEAFPNTMRDYEIKANGEDTSKNGKLSPYGYYLLHDKAEAVTGQANILLVHTSSKGSVVNPKTTPDSNDLTKQVASAEMSGTWNHATTYQIGDQVPFRIIAPIPGSFATDNTTTGNGFEMNFVDKPSEGLMMPTTQDKYTLKVYTLGGTGTDQIEYGGKTYTAVTTPTGGWPFTFGMQVPPDPDKGGGEFHFDITNMKADTSAYKNLKVGDLIVISYEAEFVGVRNADGTLNKEYSNEVSLTYTGSGDPITDKDNLYTFELDINKTDGESKQPLKGAAFSLYMQTTENDPDKETTQPKHPVTGEDLAGYWKKVGSIDGSEDEGTSTFKFDNLKDGNYMLIEDKTPDKDPAENSASYNKIAPRYYVIKAAYTADAKQGAQVLQSVKLYETDSTFSISDKKPISETKQEGTLAAGNLVTDGVENNQGVLLPETGGIGTTIFYIVGGVLVVGAVVLLITKRRAGADEE